MVEPVKVASKKCLGSPSLITGLFDMTSATWCRRRNEYRPMSRTRCTPSWHALQSSEAVSSRPSRELVSQEIRHVLIDPEATE